MPDKHARSAQTAREMGSDSASDSPEPVAISLGLDLALPRVHSNDWLADQGAPLVA